MLSVNGYTGQVVAVPQAHDAAQRVTMCTALALMLADECSNALGLPRQELESFAAIWTAPYRSDGGAPDNQRKCS